MKEKENQKLIDQLQQTRQSLLAEIEKERARFDNLQKYLQHLVNISQFLQLISDNFVELICMTLAKRNLLPHFLSFYLVTK